MKKWGHTTLIDPTLVIVESIDPLTHASAV